MKKSIAYFLCLIFAMSGITGVSAAEKEEEIKDIINIEERIKEAEKNNHRYAYIIPGSESVSMVNGVIGTYRWNSEQRAEITPLNDWRALTHNGKLAIERKAADQSNFFISLAGPYWDDKPISRRVAITVEYVDVANSSFDVWMLMDFHKLENSVATPFPAVVTEGTNEWKTVTFYVEGNAGNYIRLRTPTIQPLYEAQNSLPIANMFIEEDLGEYPVQFEAENGFTGRIYSYGDSEKMTVTYENTLSSKLTGEVMYNIRDYEGRKVYSGQLSPIALERGEKGSQEILTGVQMRGTYTLELISAIEDESGNKYQFTKNLNFSIMDTLEEGEERNPLAAFCTGFSDDSYRGGYAGGEQTARIPVSKVRLGGLDAVNVETSKGVYKDPTLNDRKFFSENGIEVYAIAMRLQPWHNGGQSTDAYPNTPEAHKGFAEYAAYIAGLPYVDTIELFNEWNHSGFSPLDQSADGYLEYCKVAYPLIKEAAKAKGKEITVLAGGTAGFAANWLERFIAIGGLNYCDGLSYHPYQSKSFNYKSFKMQTEQIKEWMLKYHGSLKPISLTEMGMSEANDEGTTNAGYPHWGKMRSVPGMYIMAQHYDVYEAIYYYCKDQTGDNINFREPGWALYKFVGDLSGNRMTAKDAAVTFAAYLDKLTGTEPGRKIEDEECTKLAYEFIKKDGSKIAALWTSTQHNTIGLKLGVNTINVYDQFGNFRTTISSNDGCYNFDLTDEIIYIEGNFETFEESETHISLSHGMVAGLMGDSVSFELTDKLNRNLTASLDYDPDVFTFADTAFKDGKLVLNASLKEGITGRYHVGVTVFDENQNVIYYARPAIDIGTEMLDVEIDTVQNSLNDSTHWSVAVTVKNISSTKTLNGTISVVEPKEYVGSERNFSELLPGEERMVKVSLPLMVVKKPQEMTVRIVLDNGIERSYTLKLDFTSANKAADNIKIDGKIDFGEWNSTLLAEDREEKYYTIIVGTYRNGLEDLSVRHKIMWDEDNFYMMAKVRDNIHYSDQSDLSMMWKDDGIQFGILKNNRETLDEGSLAFTELCISDNPAGPKVYRHSSASGKPTGEITNLDVKISRNGGYTIYEMRIPWTELLSDEHTAKSGDEYAFSFLVNDNDGGGRKGFMFYNDGIGTTKSPSQFGKLRLY